MLVDLCLVDLLWFIYRGGFVFGGLLFSVLLFCFLSGWMCLGCFFLLVELGVGGICFVFFSGGCFVLVLFVVFIALGVDVVGVDSSGWSLWGGFVWLDVAGWIWLGGFRCADFAGWIVFGCWADFVGWIFFLLLGGFFWPGYGGGTFLGE